MTLHPPPPGPVDYDDQGDPVPQPAAKSDLTDLIQLLEYARKKGFRVGPMVQVGKITTSVVDLRQSEGKQAADPDDGDAWSAAGYQPDSGQDEDDE